MPYTVFPIKGIKGDDDGATCLVRTPFKLSEKMAADIFSDDVNQTKRKAPFPISERDKQAEREIAAIKVMEQTAAREQLGNDLSAGGGKRLNAGKNKMELVPPEWIWALGDVMTQGAKKYQDRNWELGMEWANMLGCALRHIFKFVCGERYDGECFDLEKGTTGCHHLAMAAWNLLALMVYDIRGLGRNDLGKLKLEFINRVNAATTDLSNEVNS